MFGEGMMKLIFLVVFCVVLMCFVSCQSTKVETDSTSLDFVDSSASQINEDESTTIEIEEEPIVAEIEEDNSDSVIDWATEASNARDAAISVGAEALGTPFTDTEEMFHNAMAGNGGDLAEITARYKAMESYMKAYSAKIIVDENNLASYSVSDYETAESLMTEIASTFEDKSIPAAVFGEKAEKALVSYNLVIEKAYRQLALSERAEALNAKKLADSIMAGVAAKAEYEIYADAIKNGDALFAVKSRQKSYQSYLYAKEGFINLHGVVSERRSRAQEAMEEARRKVAETAAYAKEADEISPITDENQEGIEEEDAVLLEGEVYAAPESAVIEIPDFIDDMEEGENE